MQNSYPKQNSIWQEWFFCGGWGQRGWQYWFWTQGLELARQMLCCLSHTSALSPADLKNWLLSAPPMGTPHLSQSWLRRTAQSSSLHNQNLFWVPVFLNCWAIRVPWLPGSDSLTVLQKSWRHAKDLTLGRPSGLPSPLHEEPRGLSPVQDSFLMKALEARHSSCERFSYGPPVFKWSAVFPLSLKSQYPVLLPSPCWFYPQTVLILHLCPMLSSF
jgi:hypothetical protein